jgi:hypothetical protein
MYYRFVLQENRMMTRTTSREDEQGRTRCSAYGCTYPAKPGRKKCPDHLYEDATYKEYRAYESMVQGKCAKCNLRPPEEGRKRCRQCLDKMNAQVKARELKKAAAQLKASAPPIGKERRGDRRKLRVEYNRAAVAHHGKSCTCCGEPNIDLLVLEPVDDGRSPGFRVLCLSCKHGWDHFRCCPHAAHRLVSDFVDSTWVGRDPKTGKIEDLDLPDPATKKPGRVKLR